MDTGAPVVFHHLAALADPTRGRLLLALEPHELTVTELAVALQLPQSTVSRHLKTLSDEGWVAARADGTSRLYRMTMASLPSDARRLWDAVRDSLSAQPVAKHDSTRLRSVLAKRRTASQKFFSSTAGRWDTLRDELFGSRIELTALLGLLDEEISVGDLGCGTGAIAEALAPFVARVVGVDSSRAMLAAARRRLRDLANVELRTGDLEALPIGDGELGAALLVLTLHHVPEPAAALAEAARVLQPGGRLVVVDMRPHHHEEYRQEMGHVWLGFPAEQMNDWLVTAGFDSARIIALPADPAARGPTLFAASARKSRTAADTHAAPHRRGAKRARHAPGSLYPPSSTTNRSESS